MHVCVEEYRIDKRPIVCSAELFCAQLRILVEERVQINGPSFANAASDNDIRLAQAHQRRAAGRSNIRFSKRQAREIFCIKTPTHALLSDRDGVHTGCKSA